MSYFRVNENCNGCLACVQNCPARALHARDEGETRTLLHNMARCARCATCLRVCPQEAIEFEHLLHNRWDQVVTFALVRCEVCGQPLHTTRWGETVDGRLVEMTAALCPRHRAARTFLSAPPSRPGKERTP